jgi:hypothetical protein
MDKQNRLSTWYTRLHLQPHKNQRRISQEAVRTKDKRTLEDTWYNSTTRQYQQRCRGDKQWETRW